LVKEVEMLKTSALEAENHHRDIIQRMEKKFLEEKLRLQRDANKKISELAGKAHKVCNP
jgi:hypothetical protein